MVTADFRPEAEFTLFLCMHTKQIAKSPGKYILIEELFPYYRKWTYKLDEDETIIKESQTLT